jgi:ribonuclease R
MRNTPKKPKKREPLKPAKDQKLFNNLLKATQQFMQGRSFVPLTETELMERLHLHEFHRPIFQEVLKNLIKQGIADVSHGRYSWKKTPSDIVRGVLKVHPRGFGFLKADEPALYPQDIFIPKHLTQNAVDGDTVEVLVNNESISEKGPEGKVIAILSRGRTHLAGIIKEVDKNGDLVAYVPILGMAQQVIVEAEDDIPLHVGDRTVMKVMEWGTKETRTYCKVSHHLGHISDPSCDVHAAIEEYELRADFPTKAIQEAQDLGTQVPLKEIRQREDLRGIECFTIDPDTAKDFDDAISLSTTPQGHYHLGVHIADVSHYVYPGTALDEEAQIRCNSTYFPGYCLPMLPKELSDHLCSLKPQVNRLTVSVLMQFDPQGTLLDHRICRSVIKSAKRFTYREAKEVLDGKKTSSHSKTLQLMVELCGLLKRKRYERGSIEFGIPELVIIVDETGAPQKTDYVVYDITHQLVEEFMLKANEVVATHLSEQGKNLTYRIHEEPTEENLKDFSVLANAFGYKLSEKPTPKEIQQLFDTALSTPYGQYLATSYIRRMRLAQYSPENIGHYGLSLSHYCHFTSPIRRYIDLVIHRILFDESDELEHLEMIAARCSEQERISAKAENSVLLLKKLRLLQRHQKKKPYQEYEAIVTRVKNFGIFFEVPQFMLESYLHVSELEDDYYVYEERTACLRGINIGFTYRAGDKITVILKSVDLITLESKWYLQPEEEPEEIFKKKKRKRKKQKDMQKKFRRKNKR